MQPITSVNYGSDSFFSGNFEFYELIKRMCPLISMRDALSYKLAKLRRDGGPDALLKAVNDGHFFHEIFKDKDYPWYALSLVEEGRLTREQFGTLMLFWRARLEDESFQVIPIEEAFEILYESQTFNLECLFAEHHNLSERHAISAQDLQILLVEMKKYPKSEQFVFLFPSLSHKGSSICEAIWKLPGLNLFFNYKGMEMVVSYSFKKEFLKSLYGEQAVRQNIVIGLSDDSDFDINALDASRDSGVPFPGYALPKEADNYPAPGIQFTKHDDYHAFICSSIPQKHRLANIHLASLINALFPGDEIAELWSAGFRDMECSCYRPQFLKDYRVRCLEKDKISASFWVAFTQFSKAAIKKVVSSCDPADRRIAEKATSAHMNELIFRVFAVLFKNSVQLEEEVDVVVRAVPLAYKLYKDKGYVCEKDVHNPMFILLKIHDFFHKSIAS